jgi:AraC family transcriptional regulator
MAKPLLIDCKKATAGLQILSSEPLLSSRNSGWNSVYLADYSLPAHEAPEHIPEQNVIVVNHQLITVNRGLDGRRQNDRVAPGDVVVVPEKVHHVASWQREASFTLLVLEPKFIAHTAYEFVDPDQVDILPHFAQSDPLIYKIGRQLRSRLEFRAPACQLFVESAASLLAVHLLTHYCGRKHTIGKAPDGLPRSKLQLVIDYINTYLDRDLRLLELAQLVQMSRAHFIRQFKQSTGVSPHQYLIQCRLERAKTLLVTTDLNIAEIAQCSGFSSHSHLSRLFHQYLSLTPYNYRQMY